MYRNWEAVALMRMLWNSGEAVCEMLLIEEDRFATHWNRH